MNKEEKERRARRWQARSYKEAKDSVEGYKRKDVEDTGERPVKPKYTKEFSGEKSGRERELEPEIQQKETAIELLKYKLGLQGYPKNVEAFEREVKKQNPGAHVSWDMMSERRFFAEKEALAPLYDNRPTQWVYRNLEELRVRWDLKGGDFSDVTKEWFIDHPADLAFLSMYEKREKVARSRWAAFAGKVSRGGGRPKIYHTEEERKAARRKSQHKRALEARKQKND